MWLVVGDLLIDLIRDDDDLRVLAQHDGESLESTHHCFTACIPEDAGLLHTDPLAARGQHFDLVLNGVELGGGSIRNHDPEVQRHIIEDVLGKSADDFAHMIEALSYGAPPHGGIALGFDRLMMVLLGAASLRDVLAFPKSFAGRDLMGGSPSPLPDEVLGAYGLPVQGSGASPP